MDQIKNMKETLMATVQAQMANINEVDTKELGEAIDMIKDLSEAAYYCTIVEAMEKKDEGHEKEYNTYYYTEKLCPNCQRQLDREYGRMFYPDYNDYYMPGRYYGGQGGNGQSGMSGGQGGMRNYDMNMRPGEMRDYREGRSGMSRRNYMETKELHEDKAKKLQELEKYMQELTTDMVEMIEDASPEEKQLLQKKIASLASKIA